MTIKPHIFLILFILGQPLFAQQKYPLIKATSKTVDIRDGTNFKRGTWTVTPVLRPDIYETTNKVVTFYTDIDSISFETELYHTYGFIILLNGKDSAYTQIVRVPSHLDILKKAARYNPDDRREITPFTYAPMDDPDLVTIRTRFKLDSIAGAGNEISQILSLLHWVHDTFPHDGSTEIPAYTSVSDLMTRCTQSHGTLHCGALAWVLNDCYLSLGWKSRHVICLPQDSNDVDCHSIVAVYSRTLDKWLWMDPTNDAYVMDENGELLGIAEVRERLVNDKPLILTPEANWNHRSSVTGEEYLYNYMAKNLFAVQCYVTGGGESRSNVLLPVEYKGVIPRTRGSNPKCTNNPSVFWARPG